MKQYYTAEEMFEMLEPRIRELFHKDITDENTNIDYSSYEIMSWSQVKPIYKLEGFVDNAILITSSCLVEKYGHSAYYIKKSWLSEIK